jgi:hypothetical protein
MSEPRPNKYQGRCSRCRDRVGALEGVLVWTERETYVIYCGCCYADYLNGADDDDAVTDGVNGGDDFLEALEEIAQPGAAQWPRSKSSVEQLERERSADAVTIRVLQKKTKEHEEALVAANATLRALRKQLDDRIAERDAARAELAAVKSARDEALARARRAEADLAERDRWGKNGEASKAAIDGDDAASKRFSLLEID